MNCIRRFETALFSLTNDGRLSILCGFPSQIKLKISFSISVIKFSGIYNKDRRIVLQLRVSEHFDEVYFSVSKFLIFSAKFSSIVVLLVVRKEDTKSFYWFLWPAEAVFVALIS